jgi:membrane protease YdiL (CAAX protease family)
MCVRPAVDLLGFSLLLLLAAWTLLASGALIRDWTGRDVAVLVSFSAVTLLVVGTRSRPLRRPLQPGAAIAALAAGFTSYPAWAALITIAGLELGLPYRAAAPPGAGSPVLWVATLVLAPLFEELLYRERLLPALRARIGAPLAVVSASALFALPHLEPWNVLGTFLVGLMLGSVYLAARSVALCIALHAGLNLACLVCGVPPVRLALVPLAAAGLGSMLLAASLIRLRARADSGEAGAGIGQSRAPCDPLERPRTLSS